MKTERFMHTVIAQRLLSLGLSLALALAALLLGGWAIAASAAGSPAAPRRPAVVFVVTATADSPDSDLTDHLCHDTLNGGCSLRAAVQQASHDFGAIIDLPFGTLTLNNDGLGDLVVQKDTQLDGHGPGNTIIQGAPGTWTHRILRVQGGASVILSSLTISGGHVDNSNGGGIEVLTSTLLLTDSVVRNNSAGVGGGIYDTGRLDVENSTIRNNQAITYGGGLNFYATDPSGAVPAVILRNSQVLNNSTQHRQGGGIYYQDFATSPAGSIQIINSTLGGNQALGVSGDGGGLEQINGRVAITGSSIERNHAGNGGGIESGGGWLSLSASQVQTNVANENGGGINIFSSRLALADVTLRNNQSTEGAGIFSTFDRLNIVNTTFVTNATTGGDGGGLNAAEDTGFFTNTIFSQNAAAGSFHNGGGAEIGSSRLTFNQSYFSNNTATGHGGGLAIGGTGQPSETVTLIGGAISGNHSGIAGGGLANYPGLLTLLTGVDVSTNSANISGGGVSNTGDLLVVNSFIRHNIAGILASISSTGGGGLANDQSGTVTLMGSTVNDNTGAGRPGGGLFNSGASLTVLNSTINGNRTTTPTTTALDMPSGFSDISGGGLANVSGTVDLSNVTITSNRVNDGSGFLGNGGGLSNANPATATIRLRNTIVALNVDTGGQAPDCAGTFSSQGYNLVQQTTGCLLSGNTTGNLTGQDPKLKPLANYGGPTETRDLLAGSPALNAGNPGGCRDSLGSLLTIDQRGRIRPFGAACDIGAVENGPLLDKNLLLPLMFR